MYLFQRTMMDQWPEDQLENLDHFRFPIIDEGVPVGEDAPTDGFFASANAKNPEGARALLTYLGGLESQTFMSEQGSSPAVRTDVPLDIYHPLVQKGVQMVQESDALAQFYDRDTHPDMAERGLAAFIEFWNNPDDIDGILERLDEERKRVFESES
jgi:multiple sugar transport system substrate-binding protein/raffinose/stachyose/melibiose transport system substrate-binding protein